MKSFLTRTILFIGLFTAIAYIAEWAVTTAIHQSRYWAFASWNDLYQQKYNADIIIQGTSRAKVHINPAVLDSMLHTRSYNLGINGNDLQVQLCKYRIYLRNNVKPKIIIQNVDFETLTIYPRITEQLQFLPYLNDTTLYNTLKKYQTVDWKDRYLPLFRYRGRYDIFENALFNHYTDTMQGGVRGFVPQYKVWQYDSETSIQTINTQPQKQASDMLKSFLAHCQQENIKVVMVYTPYYEIKYQPNLKDTFAQLAHQYGASFLDYSQHPDFQDKDYFYNHTHLNWKGAQKLSILIAKELQKIVKK